MKPKINAVQAQMMLRLYVGLPDTDDGSSYSVAEAEILRQLMRMGYRDRGKFTLTPQGVERVKAMLAGEPQQGPDPAAVAAQEWLRTAKMTHTGYQGEHDEGGARFQIEGVPLSGPSVYDFGHGGKLSGAGISPQRTYAAFTDELVRRWNRGPVPVRKPPLPDEDEE